MALFSLGDIKFNKGAGFRKGPLAPLTESKYNNSNYRFPLDIGNADKGHYMVFYIRQQEKTEAGDSRGPSNLAEDNFNTAAQQASQLSGGGSVTNKIQKGISAAKGSLGVDQNFGNGIGGKIQSGINQVGSAMGSVGSKISEVGGNIQSGLNNVFGKKSLPIGGDSAKTRSIISTNVKQISGGSLEFLKTTKRTISAITLYMPDTLLFNFNQTYDQLTPGNSFAGQLMAAGGSNLDKIKEGVDAAVGGELSKAAAAAEDIVKSAGKQAGMFGGLKAAQAIGGGSGAGELAFLKATGTVLNPMLEMIYRSPNFRSFQFDFNFYPRDEREALEVQKILKQFQYHQAPEKSSVAGFLIPPSQFDIEFMYGGKQNPNIPAIAPACILTTIDINYAPQGASFYEVPGETSPTLGGTGMPFAVNLVLQFQETTFLTKTDLELEDGAKGSENNKYTSTGKLKRNVAMSGGQ